MQALHLKVDDYSQFKDSLQAVVYENNATGLINQSNKEL
jgi:hypothetical protein